MLKPRLPGLRLATRLQTDMTKAFFSEEVRIFTENLNLLLCVLQ